MYRPLLVLGAGVRLAGDVERARAAVEEMGIPVVSSWGAIDVIPTEHPLYIGRIGLFGNRAANLAIQNATEIFSWGCRLGIPHTGHNVQAFAREAKIVHALPKTLPVADIGWIALTQMWKKKYHPVHSEERQFQPGETNSFHFIEALCEALPPDAIVVTDMGTSFTCTFQAATVKLGQRWFTASGHAPMGYGLPGAIGAAFASGRRVICITGDGGLAFNVQELATVSRHSLPITIFVLENGGYLTMKHTQQNHFGRLTGADFNSGVFIPWAWKLAEAYGLYWEKYERERLPVLLSRAGPWLCSVRMPPMQALTPRLGTTKLADGTLRQAPLEDLSPPLPRDVLKREMLVPLVEER